MKTKLIRKWRRWIRNGMRVEKVEYGRYRLVIYTPLVDNTDGIIEVCGDYKEPYTIDLKDIVDTITRKHLGKLINKFYIKTSEVKFNKYVRKVIKIYKHKFLWKN